MRLTPYGNSEASLYLKTKTCKKSFYTGKTKMKFTAKLIIIKVLKGSTEKKVKYHKSVFMNIIVNTVKTGLMTENSN